MSAPFYFSASSVHPGAPGTALGFGLALLDVWRQDLMHMTVEFTGLAGVVLLGHIIFFLGNSRFFEPDNRKPPQPPPQIPSTRPNVASEPNFAPLATTTCPTSPITGLTVASVFQLGGRRNDNRPYFCSIFPSVSKKRFVATAGPNSSTPKVFHPNMCHHEV